MIKSGDHNRWIFLSHPLTNNGLFFLLIINYRILCFKRPPEVLEYAEMQHDIRMSLYCNNAVTCQFLIMVFYKEL